MKNLPILGAKAPDFTANSTMGPIKLSDYNGKWVVLFSHPGDFTPVCTTEFLSFAQYNDEFNKRNTSLIGLSVDSNSSHLAWLYDIFEITGVEIPFPVIDDGNRKISREYGMIQNAMSDTSTVRCVFIIDDKQILRTMLYYPLTTGRNIPEILRIIEALQTSDKNNVATPANWFPGMPVVLPYPKTFKELKKRLSECQDNKNCTCFNWYLCFMPDKNLNYTSTDNLVDNNMSQNKRPYISQNSFRPQISGSNNQINEMKKCPKINHIVMEYVLGNPKNVDPRFLDAIIYAFVEINKDGSLLVPTPTFLKQMVNMRKSKPGLKVIAAIGGWGADGFSDASLTPSSRYKFAREVNKLINEYNLDGIDIDWEYPANKAAGITAREEDKENFTLLLTAIRDVIGNDKWLSVAGTGDINYINKSADIPAISKIINYFNLMSYDFTAGETGDRGKKHQANLFDSDLQLNDLSVDKWVQNLIKAGMPSEKILLGVPFYGRLGAKTTVSNDELRKNYINKNGYFYKFDKDAKVPYLVDKDGNFAMSYENELSLFYKGQYVLNNCLGGIFSWTSTYDQANILARAMNYSIYNPTTLKNEIENIYGKFM